MQTFYQRFRYGKERCTVSVRSLLDDVLATGRGRLAGTGVEARLVRIDDVAFDERTILKCRYSCPAWGVRWTCTADAWGPHELIPLLRKYSRVVVMTGVDGDELFPSALALEREAFAREFYWALAVAVTPCYTCTSCTFPSEECRNKLDLRPESAVAGIDTMKTLDGLGIDRKPGGEFLRASFVFLD
jgi:predicted metal-binding protein